VAVLRPGRRVLALIPALLATAVTVGAQPGTAIVRVALVSQWVLTQHRVGWAPGSERRLAPEFRPALDGGVVERVVFAWQRGVIQRRTVVGKPIQVLAGAEAEALGGRGRFDLIAVRPPLGGAAWTEVDVAPKTGQPEDVLVLEIGGELNTVGQVLETLLVGPAAGPLQELTLARRAIIGGDGVPVVGAAFGRPVALTPSLRFAGTSGVEFLVARSLVDAAVNGDITTSGLADQSALQTGTGEWREGDRVFVRVPLASLRAGAPAIVLGWKDRTYRPDGGAEDQRRGR